MMGTRQATARASALMFVSVPAPLISWATALTTVKNRVDLRPRVGNHC